MSTAEERFREAYQVCPPWDIGRPQSAFKRVADKVSGRILDVGCGTGENALYFAERGHEVVGIDFLEAPIQAAREKARERDLTVQFEVRDALRMPPPRQAFDTVLDCGLFHVFSDADRPRYAANLAAALTEGGALWLLCFSELEPGPHGPRRVTQAEIRATFYGSWHVDSIEPARYEVRPDLKDMEFSPGGPHAWMCHLTHRPTQGATGE